MKFFIYITSFLCLFLSSCNASDKYVGKWETNTSMNGHNVLRIYEDGSYRWHRQEAIKPVVTGKWKVSGDEIQMTDDDIHSDDYSCKYKVIRVSDDELYLQWKVGNALNMVYEFEKTKR